jgi:hypothetical protein
MRQRSALQLRISESQSLLKIEQRAKDLGLRPMAPDQARYITVAPPSEAQASAESRDR